MTDLNSTGDNSPATRPMPLSRIAEHLRTRSGLSPILQQLIEKSHQHPEPADDDFNIQQVAIILKAIEIAKANSDNSVNFDFAAGYVAGLLLTDSEYVKAKTTAAML